MFCLFVVFLLLSIWHTTFLRVKRGDLFLVIEKLVKQVFVTVFLRLPLISFSSFIVLLVSLLAQYCFSSAVTAEEKSQQHSSVVHSTELAIDNISLTQSHSKACPSHSNSVPNPILSKYKSTPTHPKHQIPSSTPNQSSTFKHKCTGLLKPLRTKPPMLFSAKHSSHECKPFTHSSAYTAIQL